MDPEAGDGTKMKSIPPPSLPSFSWLIFTGRGRGGSLFLPIVYCAVIFALFCLRENLMFILVSVDCVRIWRQYGIHLELANKGNCTKAPRPHRLVFYLTVVFYEKYADSVQKLSMVYETVVKMTKVPDQDVAFWALCGENQCTQNTGTLGISNKCYLLFFSDI